MNEPTKAALGRDQRRTQVSGYYGSVDRALACSRTAPIEMPASARIWSATPALPGSPIDADSKRSAERPQLCSHDVQHGRGDSAAADAARVRPTAAHRHGLVKGLPALRAPSWCPGLESKEAGR